MASFRDIVDGIEILASDLDDPNSVCAEHDVIYAHGRSPDKLTAGEVDRLDDLGWTWDKTLECWSHFT